MKIIGTKNLVLMIAILLMAMLTSCTHSSEHEVKPNIIVFLVDDMGWQDTSVPFYKEVSPFNKRYHTPAMEKLASEGKMFTQAYACSVCSPTRISFLTGMNAAKHRVTNWTLKKNQSPDAPQNVLDLPQWNVNGISPVPEIENTVYATPLPQLLKNAGYFTIHCGKAHFGAIGTPGANPINLGFDVNIAGHAAGAPGSYYSEKRFGNNAENPDSPWGVPGLEKYYDKHIYLNEALTLEAKIAMDSSLKVKKPFFLYMAHYAVHSPIQEDLRFFNKYVEDSLNIIEARYASMVESMDKSLGDLMQYLDKNGLTENTIILFMSDNGGLSAVARGGIPNTHNKPLSSGKGSAHEGGIREPMIVKWPGIVQPGTRNSNYLIIEDFFPSILEIAGIQDYQTLQHVDGISFVPLLKDTGKPYPDRKLFWHFPNYWGPVGPGIGASSSIRKGDWKLIYYHADRHFELFNLHKDIGESNNLAEKEPGKLNELATDLGNYLRDSKAQMPSYKNTKKPVPYPDEIKKL